MDNLAILVDEFPYPGFYPFVVMQDRIVFNMGNPIDLIDYLMLFRSQINLRKGKWGNKHQREK